MFTAVKSAGIQMSLPCVRVSWPESGYPIEPHCSFTNLSAETPPCLPAGNQTSIVPMRVKTGLCSTFLSFQEDAILFFNFFHFLSSIAKTMVEYNTCVTCVQIGVTVEQVSMQ